MSIDSIGSAYTTRSHQDAPSTGDDSGVQQFGGFSPASRSLYRALPPRRSTVRQQPMTLSAFALPASPEGGFTDPNQPASCQQSPSLSSTLAWRRARRPRDPIIGRSVVDPLISRGLQKVPDNQAEFTVDIDMLYNSPEGIDEAESTQEAGLRDINSRIMALQNVRRIRLDQAINDLKREKEEYLKHQRGHRGQSLRDNEDDSRKDRFQAPYSNLQGRLNASAFCQNSLASVEWPLRSQNASYLYVHRINTLIFHLVAYTL